MDAALAFNSFVKVFQVILVRDEDREGGSGGAFEKAI